MRMTTPSSRRQSFLFLLTLPGLALACHKDKLADEATTGALSGRITIDGSSTVMPLSKAVAAGFQALNPAVAVDVAESGTGGGFRKFCAGQTDVEDASRPINATETADCKAHGIDYVELPVGFDSLSVVVNPKNTFVDCLTVAELKAMWEPAAEDKVKTWKQIRAAFPDRPLKLFGPGHDSGTFDYFALAIVGVESKSRNDYTSSEDDTVIERGIAADPDALGYFGYAYYQANKDQLKLLGVDSGHGCVLPSAQTVADASYQPLSRPLFIYVKKDAAKRPEVAAFARFYLRPESATFVKAIGYVPLSATAMVATTTRFDKGMPGSIMGGHGSVLNVKLNLFDDEDEDRVRALLVQ
jgi:phosphate transport system substrate-binding protein